MASPVTEIIEATEIQKFIQTDLSDIPPFRPWTKERVCLIGDAAHPMTPNLDQGGAQAVVDAFVLAQCLSKESDPASAFQEFENKRFKRVRKVVNGALNFGKLAHLDSGAQVRNFLLRHVPDSINNRSMRDIFRLQ